MAAQTNNQRQAKWRKRHLVKARAVGREAQQNRRDDARAAKETVIEWPTIPDNQGAAFCTWATETLRVPDGHPAHGAPFTLPDYLAAFFVDALAVDTHEAALIIARKNGKSSSVAALLACFMVGCLRRPGFRVGVASINREKSFELKEQIRALLAQLEEQLAREARVLPTRILTAGSVGRQASEIEQSIRRGGIVSVLQAGATAATTDPSGLRAGTIKNESSAPVVALYAQLERAVCSVLGVPPGLILSGGDGAAAREDFRRFAAATISPMLETIAAEWRAKVAPLEFNLDALRASDETARARAVGSRAGAVSKLVASGVSLDEALLLAGVD